MKKLLLLFISAVAMTSSAFSVNSCQMAPIGTRQSLLKYNQHSHHKFKRMTSLRMSKERPTYLAESEQRGAIILTFVMALCIWAFSIPPELRRDHFCFTDRCAANRSRCSDCVTVDEWLGKVKDYYANGGGVHFDFSIEEKK